MSDSTMRNPADEVRNPATQSAFLILSNDQPIYEAARQVIGKAYNQAKDAGRGDMAIYDAADVLKDWMERWLRIIIEPAEPKRGEDVYETYTLKKAFHMLVTQFVAGRFLEVQFPKLAADLLPTEEELKERCYR